MRWFPSGGVAVSGLGPAGTAGLRCTFSSSSCVPCRPDARPARRSSPSAWASEERLRLPQWWSAPVRWWSQQSSWPVARAGGDGRRSRSAVRRRPIRSGTTCRPATAPWAATSRNWSAARHQRTPPGLIRSTALRTQHTPVADRYLFPRRGRDRSTGDAQVVDGRAQAPAGSVPGGRHEVSSEARAADRSVKKAPGTDPKRGSARRALIVQAPRHAELGGIDRRPGRGVGGRVGSRAGARRPGKDRSRFRHLLAGRAAPPTPRCPHKPIPRQRDRPPRRTSGQCRPRRSRAQRHAPRVAEIRVFRAREGKTRESLIRGFHGPFRRSMIR